MSNSNKTRLRVEGMTCMSCVHHVEGALQVLAGVGAIEVKLAGGIVTIEHDSTRTTTDQLIEALDNAGYKARAFAA